MSEEKIQLLKEIYEHIILQYKLLEDANEKLSQKGANLIGFIGVILGIVVKIFIDKIDVLSCISAHSWFFASIIIILLFASLVSFLVGTKIRTFTSLITPSFLIEKFENGTSRDIFWSQFVKGAKRAYEENKKINKTKSRWLKIGNFIFLISLTLLIGYTIFVIAKS